MVVQRVVTDADFNGHVGKENNGNVEVMGSYCTVSRKGMTAGRGFYKKDGDS